MHKYSETLNLLALSGMLNLHSVLILQSLNGTILLRLAQQTLQEEDKQEMGILPQMSSTTLTKIDHPPPQLDSLRRLQKLSLAKTSRFHSSGRGEEAGTGMDLEKRMVARPSGSAPPRSTAPLS